MDKKSVIMIIINVTLLYLKENSYYYYYYYIIIIISNKYVFKFVTKRSCSFRRFTKNTELIPDRWRSYRVNKLVNIELGFRNYTLFRNG